MGSSAGRMTPKPARIAAVPRAAWDADQRRLLEGAPPLALLATLVAHPTLLRSWLPLTRTIQYAGTLPDRDRELLVLRTAWNCHSDYEWGHHVRIAATAGLSAEDVMRVASGPDAPGWESVERALLRAADELHETSTIHQHTWDELALEYSAPELIEVAVVVGQYHALAFAANALGVALEEGLSPLPSR